MFFVGTFTVVGVDRCSCLYFTYVFTLSRVFFFFSRKNGFAAYRTRMWILDKAMEKLKIGLNIHNQFGVFHLQEDLEALVFC